MNRAEKTFWFGGAAVLAAAVPATAEVYLTETQALGVVFGEKAVVRREEKILDASLRKKLEQPGSLRFPEATYAFFVATQDGKPAKYAVAINEIGKSEPITFMVGMTPEGKVSEVVIMEFRENRGWEVKEKRFLNQFRGKTVRSAIRVDEDIINYAGATLSSKAVARGVKRALLLLDAFYPGENRFKPSAARDFAMPSALTPLVTVDRAREALSLYRQARYAMGTQCEIRVWSQRAHDASILFREGFRELERIEQIFSAYRPDSELAFVNANAGNALTLVSPEFFKVTEMATQLCRAARGAVDFTIGPLQELWWSCETEQRRPAPSEIDNAKRLVGLDKLSMNKSAESIRFRRSGMKLDFGGIAKGYAAEKIGQRLAELGAVSSLVNLGRSSLYATRISPKFAGMTESCPERMSMDEWLVAIAHPAKTGETASHVCLRSGYAMSTSGTSERAMLINGERFSQIIDPRTGAPIVGMRSATAIANAGIASEVISKSLLFADDSLRNDRRLKSDVREWICLQGAANGNVVEKRSHSG